MDVFRLFTKGNREVLTFLMFLLFALLIWFLNNMERTIEAEITVPVRYAALPEGVTVSDELPSAIRVTVSDKGQNLYHYVLHAKSLALDIDLTAWRQPSGISSIPMTAFFPRLSALMRPSADLLRCEPEVLNIYFLEKESKTLPVRLVADITPDRQYLMTGEPKVEPSSVSIYAPQALLNAIDTLETECLTVESLRDSAIFTVPLKAMEGVQFARDNVSVTLKAEPYTETSLTIPVKGEHLPKGYHIHSFPAAVTVTFRVFESAYADINPDDFEFSIDCRDIRSASSNALQSVRLTRCPPYALRPQFSPDRVECLVEKIHN